MNRRGNMTVLGSEGKGSPLTVVGVLVVLGLWALVSLSGVVNSLLLPSPWRVILAARDIGPRLFAHFFATAARIVAGLTLGTALGVSLGVGMQFSKRVFVVLDGIVETTRPVPPVAVVPFFILVFGFAEVGKLLLVTLGTSLVLTVATVEAIERVPTTIMRWGLVSGLSRAGLFRNVILRAAMPELRSGLRIALATAVALVVVSEFMGAKYGMGYLISSAKVTLGTPAMIVSIILLGWLSWGLDRLLRWRFDKWCSWDVRARGAIL
jgi:ABC-type nitrate/sulfonate/bicarbonate transport system permease component